jgi:hypothetical protein
MWEWHVGLEKGSWSLSSPVSVLARYRISLPLKRNAEFSRHPTEWYRSLCWTVKIVIVRLKQREAQTVLSYRRFVANSESYRPDVKIRSGTCGVLCQLVSIVIHSRRVESWDWRVRGLGPCRAVFLQQYVSSRYVTFVSFCVSARTLCSGLTQLVNLVCGRTINWVNAAVSPHDFMYGENKATRFGKKWLAMNRPNYKNKYEGYILQLYFGFEISAYAIQKYT